MKVIAAAAIAASFVAPRDVAIEVDTSALEDGTRYPTWIERDATQTLAAAGHRVVEDAETVVVVAVRRYGELGIHTAVDVGLRGDAAVAITCEACSDEQVLAKIDGAVADLAARLAEDEPAPATEPARQPEPVDAAGPEPAAEAEPGDREPTQTDDARPRAMTWLGAVGVVVAGGGIAATALGAVDLARGEQREVDQGAPEEGDATDARTRGVALVSVGAVAIAGGVSLLIVDLVRQGKKRRTALLPALSPGMAGAMLSMRF